MPGACPAFVSLGIRSRIVVLDLHSGMDVAFRDAYDVVVALGDYARGRG